MSDLKQRMAAGAAWLVLFRLIERGIGFISTLILARLLVPGDFGLVAMATAILAALELMGAFSFDMALIQNQNAQREHYDTAWTFDVGFGLLKALAMLALAYPSADFFDEPRVAPVMMALSIAVALQGFENIGVVAFQKDLEFHKEFWFGLTKKIIGFIVTISLALWLRSHWALVGGMIALRLTGLVLSYRLHPFRPRLSTARARELFSYSKWLLLNNLLIFLNNRGTDFIIGRISGARALGLYSVSYELANLPTTELVWPISRAVFPGYSRLAESRPQLSAAFLQVIGMVALLTVPAGAIIGLLAEPVVMLLLGEKWLEAVPLIQVLAVFGIFRSLHGPTGSIYLALGKPKVVAILQCVQLGIAAALMFYCVPKWGAIGAAYSLSIAAFFAMSANYAIVIGELSLPLSRLLDVVWRTAAGLLGMGLATSLLRTALGQPNGVAGLVGNLVALTLTGLLAYSATVLLCWRLVGSPSGPESTGIGFVRQRLQKPRKRP